MCNAMTIIYSELDTTEIPGPKPQTLADTEANTQRAGWLIPVLRTY
jgi:hypothetical protein